MHDHGVFFTGWMTPVLPDSRPFSRRATRKRDVWRIHAA